MKRILGRFRGRTFRVPRAWSNRELRGIGGLFTGDIANISGWRDEDKEGGHYRDYFPHASSYTITNYRAEARGYQGMPGEIFLDLTRPLPPELIGRFDVIFNHTVLEHIYECNEAFANLCRMTRDVVIIVVPFLQAFHGDYGDYWRFTPMTLDRLATENGLRLVHCTFNEHWFSSVYLFAVMTKHVERWHGQLSNGVTTRGRSSGQVVGAMAIPEIKVLRSWITRAWSGSRR
jgi:hypothetical protein